MTFGVMTFGTIRLRSPETAGDFAGRLLGGKGVSCVANVVCGYTVGKEAGAVALP
jgi:hypothetical protein